MLDVIGIFSVSDEGTHIALLEYASQANIKIYFDDPDPVDNVKKLTQAKGGTTNIASGLEESLFMFDVDNGGMRQEVKSFFFPTKKSLLNLMLKNLQHENRLLPFLDQCDPAKSLLLQSPQGLRKRQPKSCGIFEVSVVQGFKVVQLVYARPNFCLHAFKFACMLVTWKPGTNACIPHWTSSLLNDKFPSFCRWRSFSFSSRMEPTQTPMQI